MNRLSNSLSSQYLATSDNCDSLRILYWALSRISRFSWRKKTSEDYVELLPPPIYYLMTCEVVLFQPSKRSWVCCGTLLPTIRCARIWKPRLGVIASKLENRVLICINLENTRGDGLIYLQAQSKIDQTAISAKVETSNQVAEYKVCTWTPAHLFASTDLEILHICSWQRMWTWAEVCRKITGEIVHDTSSVGDSSKESMSASSDCKTSISSSDISLSIGLQAGALLWKKRWRSMLYNASMNSKLLSIVCINHKSNIFTTV